jgi:cellulose synthase/poly-beta-1,6-N-acetylglucosamine synthase-like glycosyltransferase
VLIALAFRETELVKGILLFVMIVSIGLLFRFYLERLRLLLVPRLAAVVTIVVLLMTAISIISDQMGTETGLSVSLFPMVIISMVIERMSIVWEERGAGTAIREGVGSLAIAALAYVVMSIDILAYWVTVFPEVNLVVLGLIVTLGRYTGFRLSELSRFRQLAVKTDKAAGP